MKRKKHLNAVHPKDHVISVWWELVQQVDVEQPVLSNLIALVMETAPVFFSFLTSLYLFYLIPSYLSIYQIFYGH